MGVSWLKVYDVLHYLVFTHGGADYAHQIVLAPPNFQTFLRPCIDKFSNVLEYRRCRKMILTTYVCKLVNEQIKMLKPLTVIHIFPFICSKQIFRLRWNGHIFRHWLEWVWEKRHFLKTRSLCSSMSFTDNRWRWCCINTFWSLSLLLYLNLKTCSFYSWYQFNKGILFKHNWSKKSIQFNFDDLYLQFHPFISNDLLVLRSMIKKND